MPSHAVTSLTVTYRHMPSHTATYRYTPSQGVVDALTPLGVRAVDVTNDEMAKTHSRYLAGGRPVCAVCFAVFHSVCQGRTSV